MIDRDGLCSYSRPATLGGISWVRVPDSAQIGDSVKEQEEKVEKAAGIREGHINDLELGSEQRKLACDREIEIRKAEYKDRCKKRGYDTGWESEYLKFAHFEFVKE